MEDRKRETGQKIRKMRETAKKTQKELGAMIGRSESSVAKYEAGLTEIPLNVLERIAESLDGNLNDLLSAAYIQNLASNMIEKADAIQYEFRKAAPGIGNAMVDLARMTIQSLSEMHLMADAIKKYQSILSSIGLTHEEFSEMYKKLSSVFKQEVEVSNRRED